MACDRSGSTHGCKSLAYDTIVVDAQLYIAPELVLSFSVPDIAVGRTRQLFEVVP